MVNQELRAADAWEVLTKVAARGSTITYTDIGAEIGVHRRAVRFPLAWIQEYLMEERKPPLTVLVVNAQTRAPGAGFIASDDLEAALKDVYAHRWDTEMNPFGYARAGATRDDLVAWLLAGTKSAEELYARVKVRGTAQAVLREALLEAYDHACAFCGLTLSTALQCCHIVPWSRCGPAERMDIRNAVLLCATDHALFDSDHLDLDHNLRIRYYDPALSDEPYSDADVRVSELHGRRMTLPTEERWRPTLRHLTERRRLLGKRREAPQ